MLDSNGQTTTNGNGHFKPHTPEKVITLEVTVRESNMLELIRDSSPFCKVIVQKMNNVIVRVERSESIIIREEGYEEQTLKEH